MVVGAKDAALFDRETGTLQNYVVPVYRQMLLQIMMDYPALPDFRTLTASEIKFFYDNLRPSLLKRASENGV